MSKYEGVGALFCCRLPSCNGVMFKLDEEITSAVGALQRCGLGVNISKMHAAKQVAVKGAATTANLVSSARIQPFFSLRRHHGRCNEREVPADPLEGKTSTESMPIWLSNGGCNATSSTAEGFREAIGYYGRGFPRGDWLCRF